MADMNKYEAPRKGWAMWKWKPQKGPVDPPERDRSLATWPPEIMMLWDVQIFSGAMEIKPAFQETGSEGHSNYM